MLSENHGTLEVQWRADSTAVAVLYHGKWEPRALFISYLVAPPAETDDPQIRFDTSEVLASLEHAVRKRHQHALPTFDFGVMTLSELVWHSAESISLTFDIYLPKSDTDAGVNGTITFEAPSPLDLKLL